MPINWKISLIIPTLNAEKYLPELFKRLSGQSLKIDEIIIIDSQSIDNTVALARSLGAKVYVIERQSFDHGGTRNQAAHMSTGDVLVFMTQDAVPFDNKTIENLVKPLEEREIVLSYARQKAKQGTKITDEFLRLYNYPLQSKVKSKDDISATGIGAFQNSNVCAAYRREEFFVLGGFHTPVVSNEDMLFAVKALLAGYKTSYTADAVVWHSHNFSYTDLFKRYFDIAASMDSEPFIKQAGRVQAKGYDFLLKQFNYLKAKKNLCRIPQLLIETAFKLTGYKLGERHRYLPAKWKMSLGLNINYWRIKEGDKR